MADTMSFLPTIKCSSCGREIEISMMGEHICGPATVDAPEPTPPPEPFGGFNPKDTRPNLVAPVGMKPVRIPPPRVDTSAANRPFLNPNSLTPASASPSPRLMSPIDGRRSPFGRPMRSATAPMRSPPSPEPLSSNLDCAFPPFPKKSGKQAPTPRTAENNLQRYPEGDPRMAPVSPRMTNGGLLQRMNTIAPGPFDLNGRRPSTANSSNEKPALSAGSPSTEPAAFIPVAIPVPAPAPTPVSAPVPVPVSTPSPVAREASGHVSKPSVASSVHSRSGSSMSAPRAPRVNGYGGFGPPTVKESAIIEDGSPAPALRAQTFPRDESRDGDPAIMRPATSNSNRSMRSGSRGPDRSRKPPPRGASLARIPSADINLALEFGAGNPYHTPSDSQSSNGSGYSDRSKTSSQSSAPRSNSSRDRRKPSETANIDNLMSEIQTSMAELSPRDTPEPPKGPLLTLDTASKSPAPVLTGPAMRDWDAVDSPTDPAIQNASMGRLSPKPSAALPVLTPDTFQPRPPMRAATTPIPNPKRRVTTSKGNCKACGEAIKGKSVSSADGRLTGRYHKQCFVCTTCRNPFSTAEFYVIDDRPYCERDYHKLNGSMCHSCDRGIEGQYLETERRQKFHPHCLTCSDCKKILKADYFEMNGQVYCERDAWRRAQQPRFLGAGLTSKMERRTTRLMMMM